MRSCIVDGFCPLGVAPTVSVSARPTGYTRKGDGAGREMLLVMMTTTTTTALEFTFFLGFF